MKYSKLMRERIRRVRILFKELGYDILDSEREEDSYSAGFENDQGLQGGFFIDTDSKFLEIAFSFSFSVALNDYIKAHLEDMLKIAYEYGCYINIQKNEREITFSVFTKIYYSGLTYYALKYTLQDFRFCVESLKDLLAIQEE